MVFVTEIKSTFIESDVQDSPQMKDKNMTDGIFMKLFTHSG